MLDFCVQFLLQADVDYVSVGIIAYNTNETLLFHLNSYLNSTQDIFKAMWDIRNHVPGNDHMNRTTRLADAFLTMHDKMFSAEHGDRPEVKNVVVLLTKSVSDIISNDTISEVATARDKNIHVYAIGVGFSNTTELNQISSYPHLKNIFALSGFDELIPMASELSKRFTASHVKVKSSFLLSCSFDSTAVAVSGKVSTF